MTPLDVYLRTATQAWLQPRRRNYLLQVRWADVNCRGVAALGKMWYDCGQ
jgi:hypothetical protein